MGPRPHGTAAPARSTTALAVCGAAAGVLAVVVRNRLLRWGATGAEVDMVLPGDALLRHADLCSTRAITVDAPPAVVWPWVAQLGQGRGGFYSYDGLENLLGCDIHSADQILPDLPPPVVGGEFRLHPDVALNVAVVEAGRALVVTGAVPMGTVPVPCASTWAFILLDGPDGTTRLVTRERYLYLRPLAGVLLEPVALASFVMTERMLRGIRDRAESRHAR